MTRGRHELRGLIADAFVERIGLRAPLAIRLEAAERACGEWARGQALHLLPLVIHAIPPTRWRPLLEFVRRCPRAVQQLALMLCWPSSSTATCEAAGGPAGLVAWFRTADFHRPLPFPPPLDALAARARMDGLSEHFTAYRGAAGITAEQAAQGSSWSIHADVAAAYAGLFRAEAGAPLVVSRRVARSDVLMRVPDLQDEIVLPPAPPGTWSADMPLARIAELVPRGVDRLQAKLRTASPEAIRTAAWMAAGRPDRGAWGEGVVLA